MQLILLLQKVLPGEGQQNEDYKWVLIRLPKTLGFLGFFSVSLPLAGESLVLVCAVFCIYPLIKR